MKIPPSMIDVFFCVLLLFLVISQAANPNARQTQEDQLPDVELSSADAEQASDPDEARIRITLKADTDGTDTVFVEDRPVPLDQLKDHVRSSTRVLVRPDRNGRIDNLMRLLAELSRLQVADISFAVEQAK